MNRRMLLVGLVALLPAMACAQGGPSAAQPELPKEKLVIVTHDGQKHDFNVEMALTPQQQETGLMFRPSVPADGGMLFDWGSSREMAMWMHNTVAPLDMLFINSDGTIRRIAENTTPQSLATIPLQRPRPRHPRTRRRHRRPPAPARGRQGGAADLRQRRVLVHGSLIRRGPASRVRAVSGRGAAW